MTGNGGRVHVLLHQNTGGFSSSLNSLQHFHLVFICITIASNRLLYFLGKYSVADKPAVIAAAMATPTLFPV